MRDFNLLVWRSRSGFVESMMGQPAAACTRPGSKSADHRAMMRTGNNGAEARSRTVMKSCDFVRSACILHAPSVEHPATPPRLRAYPVHPGCARCKLGHAACGTNAPQGCLAAAAGCLLACASVSLRRSGLCRCLRWCLRARARARMCARACVFTTHALAPRRAGNRERVVWWAIGLCEGEV